jgi:HNH endonuclease
MRDRGCAFPGCTQVHHTDAHHIRHWADGGQTDIDNLVQLCRHHHRLLHEGGFRVRTTTSGGLMFVTPEGTTIPQAPRQPRGDCTQITRMNAQHRVRASAEALYPVDSVGERFELGWTVEGLLESRRLRRE